MQVNKVQVLSLSLAAVLAGPVHAQVCSGGNVGGMDATGNQCNTLHEVAAPTTASAIAPPTQGAKMGSVRASSSPARPAIRLAKQSGQNSVPTAMAVPVSANRQAAARSVSAKTAKTAAGSEAFCSGGAGGGMDVNGAECWETSAAAEIGSDSREHSPH